MQRVSEAVARGALDEPELRRGSADDQRAALASPIPGVGPASVGYILADVFHQLDEMNHISPWEQKIYELFLNRDPDNPAPVKLTDALRRAIRGWRMLAVHYIWEDLFWQRRNNGIRWLEKLIRL